MNIPGLGEVIKDERFGWYDSSPIPLEVFMGKECRFIIEGYDDDVAKEDYHSTIAAFKTAPPHVLQNAEEFVFQYYQDINKFWKSSDPEFLFIDSPKDVWKHIQLGHDVVISRRGYGNNEIYVSIECECDWEPEHGLQLVFKGGVNICKVGPYDGHVTNSDAYGDPTLENVIYRPIG